MQAFTVKQIDFHTWLSFRLKKKKLLNILRLMLVFVSHLKKNVKM